MLASVACAAALAGIGPSGANGRVPVEINDRAETYLLRATGVRGLAAEIEERGPQHPTGRRAWAYTGWTLDARYATEAGRTGCRLVEPTLVLVVVTTLPDWRPKGPPTRGLRAQWSRMLGKARAHEAVHRDHAVAAAHAAAAELATIETGPSCSDLERRVRSALRRAIAEAGRESREFDRRTDYGRREGVGLRE